MTPAIRSLNTKLLLIVVGFLILSGIFGAIRVGISETDRLELLYNQRLITLSDRYSSHLSEELRSRVFMLQAARDVLSTELYTLKNQQFDLDIEAHRQADGSYRQIDYASGIFIHPQTLIDQTMQRQIVASRRVWDRLGPVFQEMFVGFYFISEQRLSRVWPSEIAVNHRPDHDVTEEIFYTVASAPNNPNREARWTPAYRDPYTNDWLTTLVVPVYVEEKFVGVVGGDVEVAYLLSRLAMLDMDANQIDGFIFDTRDQQLLMSADFSNNTPDTQQADYQRFREDLTGYMKNVSANPRLSGSVERLTLAGQEFNIISKPFAMTDWHLSFYYPQHLIESRFRESMASVYINILVVAIFLFAVLFFSIRYFVIKRISALANATSAINRDNWVVSVPDRGRDEISQLGASINNMLDHIRHLVRGLDAKITELDKASYEARQLMSAIENSTSLVVILNKNWQLEYANSQYWQMTGLDEEQSYDGLTLLLLKEDNDENITLESIRNSLTTNGKPVLQGEETIQWQQEYHAQLKDGKRFWVMQTIAPIFGADGELEYYVCVGQNISDLKEKQDEVEKLAYYDHLTGLANRLQFKTELVRQLAHAQRNKTRLALFYLDLDHFKRINDTMGHEAGDNLLKEIARRLRLCLRQEDTIARLGGDEFAILLDNIESPQYVYVVAQKIIRALNEPVMLSNKETVVGVSIGITIAPDDSSSVDTLMKNADLAMYRAKDKGRNILQFYTADMNYAVERRLTIERELRSALRLGQFEIYYQPLIDFATGNIIAAEALIRWNHPERGLVAPNDFIPEAEDSGLIVPIGKWILKSACHQVRAMQKALNQELRLSVNVSARQLNDAEFISALDNALSASGLPAHCLNIEVTESTLMIDSNNAIARLQAIRNRGCSIAIDDFGTGYSSLSHLKRLPINCLKIDRSFVQDLPDDEEDRAITSLIIAMANSLHYQVIVEGVENEAQHNFLAECGCQYGQGYLYGRPLPSDEFMALVFVKKNAPNK